MTLSTFSITSLSEYFTADSPRYSRRNSDAHEGGLLIPQERYRDTATSYNAPDQSVVTFNLESPDQIGIPIMDILGKTDGFARIRDGTQSFNMGKKTFTLRVRVSWPDSSDLLCGLTLLQWPGYQPWAKTIAAMDWTRSRAPVTRVKLAEAVATAIRDLFEVSHIRPSNYIYACLNPVARDTATSRTTQSMQAGTSDQMEFS